MTPPINLLRLEVHPSNAHTRPDTYLSTANPGYRWAQWPAEYRWTGGPLWLPVPAASELIRHCVQASRQ
jgi:hypothetical protein